MLPAIVAMVVEGQGTQQYVMKPGDVITSSAAISRRDYIFAGRDESGKSGAVSIKGDGSTGDVNGATLRGSGPETQPDERSGTGLYIEGKNVTVKNLSVHGYKLGIVARNSPGLKVINCDASYNWKQHLLSTLDREDGSDWMSYHTNEKDEWVGYGAAIYLRGCDGFEVKGCSATGGQCGLMMTECNEGLVWNNDFSFLSGIGIGMYRSSKNRVMHNNVDWCVRGYSHGVYNRGQDSAGILIYEQSNDNVFAYNSVTHGGDGFFLWAGQTTMDTGKGGCNGNLLFGNDFSHAPTNGIEATFSKNTFVNNLVLECWHGIWAGYSWETKVIANTFGLNAEGIAWEHGQDNQILYNTFDKNRTAIDIWQKDSEDPNWGYAKQRDTRSRDNTVSYNVFRDTVGPVVRLSRSLNFRFLNNQVQRTTFLINTEKETDGLTIAGNKFTVPFRIPLPVEGENQMEIDASAMPALTAMTDSGNLVRTQEKEGAEYLKQFQTDWDPFLNNASDQSAAHDVAMVYRPEPLEGGKNPFLKPDAPRGRKTILIDEWGPYDFRSPLMWPTATYVKQGNVTLNAQGIELREGQVLEQHFDLLGPKGTWRLGSTRGVSSVSANSGTVPGTFVARMEAGKATDVYIELIYTGPETTDVRGVTTPAGKPVKFSYSKFFAPISWSIKWFGYDSATEDPRNNDAWKRIMTQLPLNSTKTAELNYAWGGSPATNVPGDHFLTLAEGSFEISQGEYDLEVTSDDGVRVYLDGKVVLEDWTWHPPKTQTVAVRLGGKHTLRVEHFELDGYSALKVVIKRKR